jgi:hypothetical protein
MIVLQLLLHQHGQASLCMSVTQAASHTRVPDGGVIIARQRCQHPLQRLDLDVAADVDHNPACKPNVDMRLRARRRRRATARV